MLGNYIILNGIAHTLLWYSIIILQGLVVCLLIKKPPYLKNLPTNYKLIKVRRGSLSFSLCFDNL